MKVSILGAGFCGLAVAWHLLHHAKSHKNLEVRLYDSEEIGFSTSGISAGLLHPYVGAHAKLNWRGREGFKATKNLLDAASLMIDKPVFAENKGILRMALTQMQSDDFILCEKLHFPDVEWLSAEKCRSFVPGLAEVPALWLKNGLTVYSKNYLLGLWKACEIEGALLEKRRIHAFKEVQSEIMIITTGGFTQDLPELSNLPLRSVKGQILELEWPKEHPPLPCALNSQAYILMSSDQRTCFVGTTYEKKYRDAKPDPKAASAEIMPKACAMLPFLKEARLVNCYAGLRSVGPGHLPFLHSFSWRTWILAGMGSKGLLYHALLAKELADLVYYTQENTPF
ncbi:MAG: FAD-binding oxidoreductase [Candidatus Protochlamydia sp.]|nr:FAD-binding oxidoreductase [Candidatus Protochlamydia sp.]